MLDGMARFPFQCSSYLILIYDIAVRFIAYSLCSWVHCCLLLWYNALTAGHRVAITLATSLATLCVSYYISHLSCISISRDYVITAAANAGEATLGSP